MAYGRVSITIAGEKGNYLTLRPPLANVHVKRVMVINAMLTQ